MSQITTLSFEDIKEQLKTELKKDPLLKDYNFEGSTLNLLLSMLSRNTHYNQMYNNMTFAETHLSSAQIENNIISSAKNIGYLPDSRRSAIAKIKITINPEDTPEYITIKRGDQFQATVDGRIYTFSAKSTKIITPLNNVYSTEMEIIEGIPTVEEITVDDIAVTLFPILNEDVDLTTLQITVRENETSTNIRIFKLAENIIEITKDSEIYFLQKSFKKTYEIEFGDGDILGKNPTIGNVISISYIISSGSSGNNINTFSPKSNIDGYSNYTIDTITPSIGGKERESKESIVFHAPKSYSTQGRSVIEEDYSRNIQDKYRGEFEAVASWGGEKSTPPQYGKTFISVKPFNGFSISENKKIDIKNYIKKRNVVTIEPIIIDPVFLYISPKISIVYNPDLTTLSAYDIDLLARKSIIEFEDSSLTTFNKQYINSDLQLQIGNIDPSIVSIDTDISLQKRFLPYKNQIFNYEIFFNHALKSLKSSKFTLPDSPKIMKISDNGAGVLYTYFVKDGEEIIVNSNQGKIDYNTGRVFLTDFSPSSIIDGDEIKIICIPLYKDAIPSQNQIILIADSNINILSSTDRKLLTTTTVETKGDVTTQYEIPIGSTITI